MNPHQPYTNDDHWKAFWRMFYKRKQANQVIEIPITEQMREDAQSFSKQIIKEKMKEKVHQRDSNHEWKRWMIGVLGEIALESFLNTEFRDVTIGKSKHYAVPDLAPINLRVGVKAFRVGNFPLVNRSKTTSTGNRKELDGQIFIAISQDLKTAFLFGIAFDEQLSHNENNPNNNRYVKDGNALKRKVAFTEMDSLQTFQSLSELQQLADQHNCLLENEIAKIS